MPQGMRKKLLILVSLAVLAFLTVPLVRQGVAQPQLDQELKELRFFADVLAEIKAKYVEKKTSQDLLQSAIKGMVSGLDPHSAYLTPAEYKDLQIETRGKFSGVGIQITLRNNVLTVISPIEGTPAFKAGVKAGDRIIKIDGKLTKGMSMAEAVKSIRGPKGTKVVLTVLRKGESKLRDIAIIRGIISLKSVRYSLLEDGYGYVRVSTFREDTTSELRKALVVLQGQPVSLKGLVLDLRNDPGGLLQQAVNVADLFLDQGLVVVSTRGRERSREMVFRSTRQPVVGKYPLIVLVNHGTASASEIVAGALQDHRRAVILGTRTFGKASVQTIIPLSSRGALRLTTARYYTPKGRAIQVKGITPDLVVPFRPPAKESKESKGSKPIREGDLPGAMDADQDKEKEKGKPKAKKDDKLYFPAERLQADNQLTRALDLLKAWQVFSHRTTAGADASR